MTGNLFGEEEVAVPESYDKDWQAFKAIYPRREKWMDARKAWIQLQPGTTLAAQILEDVRLRTQNNWHGKEKSYIPLPASYLRGHRWEDEIYKNGNGNGKDITGTQHGKFDRFISRSGKDQS